MTQVQPDADRATIRNQKKEETTVEETQQECRYFISYSGVKLPLNLVTMSKLIRAYNKSQEQFNIADRDSDWSKQITRTAALVEMEKAQEAMHQFTLNFMARLMQVTPQWFDVEQEKGKPE